jgi:hypothetical protein
MPMRKIVARLPRVNTRPAKPVTHWNLVQSYSGSLLFIPHLATAAGTFSCYCF